MSEDEYTEGQLLALFRYMYPNGLNGKDVIDELAPEGWINSPLLASFHPSIEILYDEHCRFTTNLQKLTFRWSKKPPKPIPTFEEFKQESEEEQGEIKIDVSKEVEDLVGLCLWDVFSNNHEVRDSQGREVNIGSFRGAGRFLSFFVESSESDNTSSWYDHGDYLRFYMGTIWISERCDLSPVYEMIFLRMKRHGLDWAYEFPRVYVFRPIKSEADDKPEWEYSPSESFQKDLEEKEQEAEHARLQEALDESHREAIEKAKLKPPPPTVVAYRKIYGHSPEGWPPKHDWE